MSSLDQFETMTPSPPPPQKKKKKKNRKKIHNFNRKGNLVAKKHRMIWLTHHIEKSDIPFWWDTQIFSLEYIFENFDANVRNKW